MWVHVGSGVHILLVCVWYVDENSCCEFAYIGYVNLYTSHPFCIHLIPPSAHNSPRTGLLPLWLAVALHEGTTFMVALNSLRLLHIDAHADLMQGAMVSDAPAGRGGAGAGAAPAKAVTGTAAMSVPREVNGTPAVAKQAAPAVNGDGRHVLVRWSLGTKHCLLSEELIFMFLHYVRGHRQLRTEGLLHWSRM